MAERTDFVDELYRKGYLVGEVVGTYGSRTSTYQFWRNFAEYLDTYEQGFPGDVNDVLDVLQSHWNDKRISDYYAYSALYNMLIGVDYHLQEPDEPVRFIGQHDIESGAATLEYFNPERYTGDRWDVIDFLLPEATAIGGRWAIVNAIKTAVSRQGATLMYVYIREKPVKMLFGKTVSSSYAVSFSVHGSPLPLPVIIAIIAGLVIVFGITAWAASSAVSSIFREKEITKRDEITADASKYAIGQGTALKLKAATDPNLSPQQAQELDSAGDQLIATGNKALNALGKAQELREKAPSSLSQIGDLVKWGIIGLGVVMILPLVTEAFRSTRRVTA